MPATLRLSCLAAFFVSVAILLLPAAWNGFPFLFSDSGAYLDVAADWFLWPGRSALYGIPLVLGQWPDFWPVAVAQAGLTVWIVSLALRAFDLAQPLVLVAVIAFLSFCTALPWLAGELMPDLFAGLAVIAVWLLVFHEAALSRRERIGLIAFAAYAAAIHSATLAVLLTLLAATIFGRVVLQRHLPQMQLRGFSLAVAASAVLVLLINFLVSVQFTPAFSARLTFTPGTTGFVFSRLVEDGIVARFLQEHCPDPRFKLCAFRNDLPNNGDEFLWKKDGPFEKIGGFDGGAAEMRTIIGESLRLYPVLHAEMALRATARQLVKLKIGDGVDKRAAFAYGMLKEHSPHAVAHALAARQAKNGLPFGLLNRLHVPVTLAAMAALALFAMFAFVWRQPDALDTMALAFTLAILANAFICGVFSGPHDRYGTRVAWLAVFFVAVFAIRRFRRWRLRPESSSAPPAP